MDRTIVAPEEVLAFWFGPGDRPPDGEAMRERWFKKSSAFDDEVRRRFASTHEAATTGALASWESAPRSCLALVIVLDQFSRNLHRDSPRAFAADARALALARGMIAREWDRSLAPLERLFVYLPFEHAEDLEAQRESLRLFREIDALPEGKGLYEWADKHYQVIARFGRFPHRNVALGRASTAAELAFLAEPGSRF